ncbi:MAG: PhzF family phenazine biosynthesis protein, partial [Actinomycetota bacterium]|nr:PhzF family phenazine biosynthesis protein [Actinomycetota bacterium]
MDFLMVSVFWTDDPYRGGNPLAVFPDAGELDPAQMQAIAQTLSLSETAFVTGGDERSYDVRIFTPREEIGFAGHPTLGTAWTLRHLGRLTADEIVQRSAADETPVTVEGDLLTFRRSGKAARDIEEIDIRAHLKIARALGLDERDVTLEAYELGRSGLLRPALVDAGLEFLLAPLRGVDALGRVEVDPKLLAELSPFGVYCFTAVAAGRVRARALIPSTGIPEDAATGSAA